MLAALDGAYPGIAAAELTLLQHGTAPPTGTLLAAMLNRIVQIEHFVVPVLDDFHVIMAAQVREWVTFLLDHLLANMHLVIASRADPALPLARWRARDDVVEVRAADLRFTPDEAAAFLTNVMGIPLTGADIAALDARTEG